MNGLKTGILQWAFSSLAPTSTSTNNKEETPLELLKQSLLFISAAPSTDTNNPSSAQFTQTILSTKYGEMDDSYSCQLSLDGKDFMLAQMAESPEVVLSTNTPLPITTTLNNTSMADLKKAMLIQHIASEQRLGKTNIDLSGFDLKGVDLSDINFTGTILSQEIVREVIASQGDLSGASLAENANVEDLPFAGVKMDRSMLLSLILGKADLRGINVSGKDLSEMPLMNVDFSGADFTNANLSKANLKGTDFTNANLTGATLKDANIHLAVLISTTITDAQVKTALGLPVTEQRYKRENLPKLLTGDQFNVYNSKGIPDYKGDFLIRNNGRIQKNSSVPVEVDRVTPHQKLGKEFEYPSQSRNDQFPIEQGGKNIACRHSTTKSINDALTNPKGKLKPREFSTEQALTNHIPPSIEQTWDNLLLQAMQSHLINNNLFGDFLSEQFTEMEKNNVPLRAMAIVTGNHAMAVILRFSTDSNNDQKYSVQFMEPNVGEASPVHSKASNPQQLENQKLYDYIKSDADYNSYFDTENPSSLIFVLESPVISEEKQPQVKRPFIIGHQASLAPIQLALMVQQNLSADTLSLKSHLSTLSQAELCDVLGYSKDNKTPIKLALTCGSTQAIHAYGELLKLVNDEGVRANLLSTTWNDTWSAMKNGHWRALYAYNQICNNLLSDGTLAGAL